MSGAPLWTAREIAAAVAGEPSADFAANGVAFDSREVGPGDLFVALKGESADGHAYLDKAFAAGAAGAIVAQPTDHPHVRVADTAAALDALGRRARGRTAARIVGVTGSAGKTGTKEALYAAFARMSFGPGGAGRAHRSVKSYNNHVGVPLSLARMPADSEWGVFEMGMNHAGELAALTRLVRPHCAIVTTIAPAHAEYFADESAIADAKGEIFEGLVEGGVALVPADSPHRARLTDKAKACGARVLSFGFAADADIRGLEAIPTACGSQVTARLIGGELLYTLSQPGRHWIANSLAVLGAVEALGGDVALAGLALADLEGMAGRGARHRIAHPGGDILIIDESYNANPASMAATIAELGREPAPRAVLLGGMRELGAKGEAYHAGLAPHLADAGVTLAVLVGAEMDALASACRAGLAGGVEVVQCADADAAATLLAGRLSGGEALLIKGSNFYGLDRAVRALTERLPAPVPEES